MEIITLLESLDGDKILGSPLINHKNLNAYLSEAWRSARNSNQREELMKRIHQIQIRFAEARCGDLSKGMTSQMRTAIQGTQLGDILKQREL